VKNNVDIDQTLAALEFLFALNVHCHTLYPVYLVDQLVVHQTLRAIKNNDAKDESIEKVKAKILGFVFGDVNGANRKSLKDVYDIFGKNTLAFRLLIATSLINYKKPVVVGSQDVPPSNIVDNILAEKLNELSLKNASLQQDLKTLSIKKDIEIEELRKQINENEYLKTQFDEKVKQALESVVAEKSLKITTNYTKEQTEEENKRLIKVNSALKAAYDQKSLAAQELFNKVNELKSRLNVYVEKILLENKNNTNWFSNTAPVLIKDLLANANIDQNFLAQIKIVADPSSIGVIDIAFTREKKEEEDEEEEEEEKQSETSSNSKFVVVEEEKKQEEDEKDIITLQDEFDSLFN